MNLLSSTYKTQVLVDPPLKRYRKYNGFEQNRQRYIKIRSEKIHSKSTKEYRGHLHLLSEAVSSNSSVQFSLTESAAARVFPM